LSLQTYNFRHSDASHFYYSHDTVVCRTGWEAVN